MEFQIRIWIFLTFRFVILKAIYQSDIGTSTAQNTVQLNGLVEYNGALKIKVTRSLVTCSGLCFVDGQCVSFFYNGNTKECVLHSELFATLHPGTSVGWKYYITQKAERCSSGFMYFEQLNFCYSIHESSTINFDTFKSDCASNGARLARIDSKQKQEFFENILESRITKQVCIAGRRNMLGTWTYDDGTGLAYFKWSNGEPDGPILTQGCVVLNSNNFWESNLCFDTKQRCIYVCEM